MKCAHCTVEIHEDWKLTAGVGQDADGTWDVFQMTCPACKRFLIRLNHRDTDNVVRQQIVKPRGVARSALGSEVPSPYADDYREACIVLADSPKASAALSRRCLQSLLREVQKVNQGNLADEIEEAIPLLPSHLGGAIDAIRNIGNFSAHPMKSTNSGEIVDVEPGEAEWSLEVIEGLFDHYFIQPERLKGRKAALDAKLNEAGKPPSK